jgi:hypothetical protein
MRRHSAVFAVVVPFVVLACATIMHGTNQNVGISTPLILQLPRKDNHIVKIELDGYQPFEATLTRKTSGWVWGNIVFGGIIGLAVDAMTVGCTTLAPSRSRVS